MDTLKIINFKAHQNLDEIKLNQKNFLLYGDNGAGKSSIYEALKLCFFKERIEREIPTANTPEAVQQRKQDFYVKYNNKTGRQNFEIKINNEDFASFQIIDYRIFMLNLEDTFFERSLKLSELYDKVFFTLPDNILAQHEEIKDKANEFLEKCLENIKIDIDHSDDYSIRIEDRTRNIASTKEIKGNFNEAKLNLVIFALLFSSIQVVMDTSKKNILILDDFITSLDMSNRTFLMTYILDSFKDFQILVFTHNIYFYNLIMYLINDNICETTKEWQFANIFEIANEHKLYVNDIRIDASTLRKNYNDEVKKTIPNFSQIGNQIRQKFERLLYEFSKILMIGSVEESNKILEIIEEQECLYLLRHEYKDNKNKTQVKYKNSNDLISDIEKITTSIDDVKSKINEYKIYRSDEIKEVLTTLKLYRKVMMHPSSHGQLIGAKLPQEKELKYSIDLIEKLEKNIKDLTNKKVD